MADLMMEDEVFVSNITDEIEFIETDAEVMEAELVSDFEQYLGETLYAGDERRIFLQGLAYALTEQLVKINETGRGNLLRYAENEELDAQGEDLYRNPRLQATAASVTLQFTLSGIQSEDVIVPKGTKVTPDGNLFFATDEEIIFPAGSTELTMEVSATATDGGTGHNDIDAGKINKIVDTVPYIASVTSTTTSGGGSDVEADDEYKERLRKSPFTYSTAGPSTAYEAIALGASPDVMDVSAYSPSAGVVELAIVKDGGVIPAEDDELLSIVLKACSAKTARPLTDNVRVVPATGVNTDIEVKYYIANGDTSKISAIEGAVEEYKSWQVGKIGRDINPTKLNSLMQSAGAAHVVITKPEYRALEQNEIASFGTVTITYGGSISM